MPTIQSIDDSIELHEKAFTAFFAAKGFSWEVAFPTEAGELGNVTIASPIQQMADGCPTLKYRAFTFSLESLRHREAPLPARTLVERHRGTLSWMPNFAFNHVAQLRPSGSSYDLTSMRAFIA